jgi:hypothetical protein
MSFERRIDVFCLIKKDFAKRSHLSKFDIRHSIFCGSLFSPGHMRLSPVQVPGLNIFKSFQSDSLSIHDSIVPSYSLPACPVDPKSDSDESINLNKMNGTHKLS